MKAENLKILKDFLIRVQDNVFPVDLSIKLYKIRKETDEFINTYQSVLDRIIKNCVVLNEQGAPNIDKEGKIEIISDKAEEWKKEIADLENTNFTFQTTITEEQLNMLEITPLEVEPLMELKEKHGN